MFSNYQQTRDWEELHRAIDAAPEIVPCTNDPDSWFPEAGGETSAVKKLCKSCPVVEQCAEYGIKWEYHGIWGGLTGNERIEARKKIGIRSNPLARQRIAQPLQSSVDPFLDSDFAESLEFTDFFESEPIAIAEL